MVFNGTRDDKLPLICNGMTVDVCESYTYLGTIFTLDGKVETGSLKMEDQKMQDLKLKDLLRLRRAHVVSCEQTCAD